MTTQFVWDNEKNRQNVAKHGVDFGDAVRVFAFDGVVELDDLEDYGEDRYLRFGYLAGVPVAVAYPEPDDYTIRIISFRKASRAEAEYLDQFFRQRHRSAPGDD